VGVVGLGGVGSWAAEALARSGVAAITLVDMDHVAESNLNRQVQALHSTLGVAKGNALEARIVDIAPDCGVCVIDNFLTADNASVILTQADFWIDATDDLSAKRSMILWMRDQKRLSDLVVSGGAGGKTDPTRVSVMDLAEAAHDPLLSSLRYDLRKNYGYPRKGKIKIPVVSSNQPIHKSDDCDPAARLACAGYGSLVTVTAVMGLVAASTVLARINKQNQHALQVK
jgi:tRNA A37 threonylcarbamoyladenosine dehydratase